MNNLFDALGIDIGIVVLLLIILVIIMTVMTVSMSIQLNRLKRKYKVFMKGKDAQSLERVFAAKFKEIDKLTKVNEGYQFDIELI